MMTEEEIDAIRKRCREATPFPWDSFIESRDKFSGSSFIRTPIGDIYLIGATDFDQDFIAHAREDIPKLLEEIERLKNELYIK